MAPAAGLEPATKRLTAAGLQAAFVLRIGRFGAIESHSESHASVEFADLTGTEYRIRCYRPLEGAVSAAMPLEAAAGGRFLLR